MRIWIWDRFNNTVHSANVPLLVHLHVFDGQGWHLRGVPNVRLLSAYF